MPIWQNPNCRWCVYLELEDGFLVPTMAEERDGEFYCEKPSERYKTSMKEKFAKGTYKPPTEKDFIPATPENLDSLRNSCCR